MTAASDPKPAKRSSRTLPSLAIKFLRNALLREHREHTIIQSIATKKMPITTFKLAGLRCTYIQGKQAIGKSFRVVLPNGRNVDVFSKEGAHDFIDTVGTDFISTNLNAHDLANAYALMVAVAESASDEKIAS